jgi:NTE family protein
MTSEIENSKNVALVLSGGGARGMAHIGVIEELLKSGYTITSISGTSIGSLIAGVYVSGQMDEFKEWVTQITRLDVFKFMDFAISKSGFIKGEKIFDELKKFILDANIEDLAISYVAVAVDIKNHKEVVFQSGPLRKAIRASVSIPTVLKPVFLKGQELVDGGVLNPLPISCIERNEGDILIAVDLGADIPYPVPKSKKVTVEQENNYRKTMDFINEKWTSYFNNGKQKHTGFFDLITESLYAMQMKLTQITIKEHNPHMVVNISRKSCDLFEYHRSEELIQYGRKQFKKSLKEYKIKNQSTS